MEIILLKNIDKVGDKHEVVTVKNGYARNYLIPNGLALIHNDTNSRRLKDLRNREEKEIAKKLDFYKEMADRLKDITLKIGAKAGTSGKIFGSVTNVQLAAALKDQCDIEIERRKISLPEEVKNIGAYVAVLDLHPEVKANVNFEVIAE